MSASAWTRISETTASWPWGKSMRVKSPLDHPPGGRGTRRAGSRRLGTMVRRLRSACTGSRESGTSRFFDRAPLPPPRSRKRKPSLFVVRQHGEDPIEQRLQARHACQVGVDASRRGRLGRHLVAEPFDQAAHERGAGVDLIEGDGLIRDMGVCDVARSAQDRRKPGALENAGLAAVGDLGGSIGAGKVQSQAGGRRVRLGKKGGHLAQGLGPDFYSLGFLIQAREPLGFDEGLEQGSEFCPRRCPEGPGTPTGSCTIWG